MRLRPAQALLLLFIAALSISHAVQRPGQAPGAAPSVAERLERLAAATTHFATADIIQNGRSERRWPAELIEEQDRVAAELRTASSDRDAIIAALAHSDPKVRTLALGALFMREDPRDLPLLAGLRGDSASTYPLLRQSPDSRGGPLPVTAFESAQTVGDVAKAMITFWLSAAYTTSNFEDYWSEHGARERTASWFLVKMRRSTRQTLPLQPQYESDVRRVLSEIDALPPVERAWTLLYVRSGSRLSELDSAVPDAAMVNALQIVGPDALMKFLRRESPTDDPDLRPAMGNSPRAGISYEMIRFILANARDLLRAGDADAVQAGAETDRTWNSPTMWRSAAAELRALQDPQASAESLKTEIVQIPLRGYEGQGEQAALAATVWRMRGAREQVFLANWIYTTLPLAQNNMAHAPQSFLRAVEKEARADTPELLSAIVSDPRFSRTDWPSLAQILTMVNEKLSVPLVDTRAIYDHQPGSNRADQRETLAAWRNLLRRHFGLPLLPPAPGAALPLKVVSAPAWAVPLEEVTNDAVTLAVSPDGRFLSTAAKQSHRVTIRNAGNGETVTQINAPTGPGAVLVAYAPETLQPLFFTSSIGNQKLQQTTIDGQSVIRNLQNRTNSKAVVDRGVTRYASESGVLDLKTGNVLWRLSDSPGDGAEVAISADGRVMALSGRHWPQMARIFDAGDGRLLRELVEFSSPVSGLALSPDGKLLAVASPADGIQVWNLETGRVDRSLAYPVSGFAPRDHSLLLMSADGRWLAIHHASQVGIFDLSTGDLRWEVRLTDGTRDTAIAFSPAFSPDGGLLYTANSLLSAWRLE